MPLRHNRNIRKSTKMKDSYTHKHRTPLCTPSARLIKISFCLLRLGAAPFAAIGAEGEASLTLQQVFDLALRQDAEYEAGMHGAGAQRADGWEKIAGYGPTLSLTGSYGRHHDKFKPDAESELESSEAHYNEKDLTLSFEQPIFDGVKAAAFQQGRNDLKLAELQLKTSYDDLYLRIASAYYEALSTKESLRIAGKQTSAIKGQLQNAIDLLSQGSGTITDQYEAESRYRLSAAAEISRDTEWKNARTELAKMIGGATPSLEDTVPHYDFKPLIHDKKYWLSVADSHNTDLMTKRLQLAAAEHTYTSNQSRFLPSLSLYADLDKNEPDGGLAGYGEDRTEFEVGVLLRLSLLEGGSDVAATTAAYRRVKEADALLRSSQQDVGSSLEALYDNINDTANLIEAYARAAKASRLAMESTEAAYLEGVKALPDVLDRQQEYYESLGQYHRAQYSYMILLAKFERVAGVKIAEGNESESK